MRTGLRHAIRHRLAVRSQGDLTGTGRASRLPALARACVAASHPLLSFGPAAIQRHTTRASVSCVSVDRSDGGPTQTSVLTAPSPEPPGTAQGSVPEPPSLIRDPDVQAPMDTHHKDSVTIFLSKVNDLTKWAVSAAVFAVLVVRRDTAVAWCVLGSIIASFLNKALKYIINEQRPANARKADPGMPSSHANSLAFLGAYTSLALSDGAAPLSAGWLAAAAVLALSVFLTWLRVRLGFHTTPQVLVGYALGAATAAGWHRLGTRHFLETLEAQPGLRLALYGCTGLAVTAFAVRNVRAWFKERAAEGGHGSKLETKAA